MSKIKHLCVLFVFVFWGCATVADNEPSKKVNYKRLLQEDLDRPIKGTDTAVVEIGLDSKGMPFVKRKGVVVKVGQRVVLVGPEKFNIRFPEGTPFESAEYETGDAVMNFEIPREIKKSFKNEKEPLIFKYDIIVGNQVLDPFIIIMPQ